MLVINNYTTQFIHASQLYTTQHILLPTVYSYELANSTNKKVLHKKAFRQF